MTLEDIIAGRDKSELIVLTVGDVRYIAESYPEASPTESVWSVSKNETVGGVEKVEVKLALKAPGVDGAGLPAIFGD